MKYAGEQKDASQKISDVRLASNNGNEHEAATDRQPFDAACMSPCQTLHESAHRQQNPAYSINAETVPRVAPFELAWIERMPMKHSRDRYCKDFFTV